MVKKTKQCLYIKRNGDYCAEVVEDEKHYCRQHRYSKEKVFQGRGKHTRRMSNHFAAQG